MSQSVDQIREIIVGEAIASETTLGTFLSGASPKELAVVSADGTAPAYGKPFFIVGKHTDGSLIKSDIIKPETVKRVKGVPYVAPVQKVVTVSSFVVPSTNGDVQEYMVEIRLLNQGSLSVNDWLLYFGHTKFTKTSTNDAEDVVDALIASLNRNFSKVNGATATTNPYFTFAKTGSGSTAALTITSKSQPYVAGKKFARPVEFEVNMKEGDATVAVTTPGKVGVGAGPQVAQLEYFLRGFRGDYHRGTAYPFDWPYYGNSDGTGTYNGIEILHIPHGEGGINEIKARKESTVAVKESSGTTLMEALLEDINTFVVKPDLVE